MAMRTGRRLDLLGAGLVAAAILWTLTGARAPDDRPWPVVAGYVLAVVAFEAGRRLARARGPEATVAMVGALWLLQVVVPRLVKYPNAGAAMDVQAGLAGLLVVLAARDPRARPWGAGLGLLALVALASSGSVFAFVSLGVALVVIGLSHVTGRLVPAAMLVLAGVGGLVLATAVAPVPDRALELETLAVRVDLWDEAALLLEAEPWSGVGPGRFEEVQRVSDDNDLRFAHSAPLQQGAEQGYPGLVLLLAVGGWAVARLAHGATGAARPAAAVGLGALGALAAHASVDFVLHFPLVLAVGALLVGAGAARDQRPGVDPSAEVTAAA